MVRKYGHGGWFLESQRHSLSAKGVKTGKKDYAKFIVPPPAGSEILFGVGSKAFDDLHKKHLTVDIVKDALPHGSGINGDWNVYEKDGKIYAENFYDTMTEYGMYDRPAYFRIVIDKKNPKDFKLHFTDKTSQYLNNKYMLRDYLEESIHYGLEDELKKKGIDYARQKEYIKGGLADNIPSSRFSKKQLKLGITVEREHTSNPKIAEEIARDHLVEDKNYYTHLMKMEREVRKMKQHSLKDFGIAKPKFKYIPLRRRRELQKKL